MDIVIPNLDLLPTVQNASLVKLSYFISVQTVVHTGSNLKVHIPIIISTFPPLKLENKAPDTNQPQIRHHSTQAQPQPVLSSAPKVETATITTTQRPTQSKLAEENLEDLEHVLGEILAGINEANCASGNAPEPYRVLASKFSPLARHLTWNLENATQKVGPLQKEVAERKKTPSPSPFFF
jgi:hypothetical protein